MVRGELGTYPCSVSCDGAGGGETGWCSVTCCQEPADRPKTGAWRTGSGAALRIAGLEAEETPPPTHPHTLPPRKKCKAAMKTEPVLTASWDRRQKRSQRTGGGVAGWGEDGQRLNEDMYLGSGFEVEWFFLVEGRRGQRAF